nr:histone acetyltransferase p300 [Hymenolepis microstoma]
MKRLTKMAYNHYIACPQRSTDFCSLCYQIIRCIAPHSAHCDRVNCPVPFCKDPNARITPAGSVHSSQSQNQFNLPSTSGTAPHSICDVWQQQQNTTTLNNPKQLSQNPGTDEEEGNMEPNQLTITQNLLVKLLHVQVCRSSWNEAYVCPFDFCPEITKLYRHYVNCWEGLECQEPWCITTWDLLKHYRNCNEDECEFCRPVRVQHELNTPLVDPFAEFSPYSQLPPDPNPVQWQWPPRESTSLISTSPDKNSQQPRKVSDLPVVPFACESINSLGISSQCRTQMIHSIIDFVLPNSSPEIYGDPMINDVIDNASRLEYIAFAVAKSIEAYNTEALKLATTAKSELEEENWTKKYARASEKSIPVCERNPIDKTRWKQWGALEIYGEFVPLVRDILISIDGDWFRDLRYLRPTIRSTSGRVSLPEVDLNKIMIGLENGLYSDPWDVVKDFHQIYKYVSQNFEESESIHKAANKFLKRFCSSADPIMQKLGYCCATYYYKDITFTCDTGNRCPIKSGQKYLEYVNSDKRILTKNLYRICYPCFEKLEYKGIFTDDLNKSAVLIPRNQLSDILVNKAHADEHLIRCRECGRRFHALCVLYKEHMWPNGYICKSCVQRLEKPPIRNLLTARNLPRNRLSDFIEERVHRFLRNKKSITTGKVIIRVLSSVDKFMQVKPLMRAYLQEERMSTEPFSYRQKVVFAFQEVDGNEVCIFGFYSHEHGLNSLPQNRGRVFIECVDCLPYFQPDSESVLLYQTILTAYLEYVRNLGFWCAHLHSGSKEEGEIARIFFGNSQNPLIRNRAARRVLYNGIFQILINELIAQSVEDIYDESLRSDARNVNEMPYFEGDLWPDVIEFCLQQAVNNVRQITQNSMPLADIMMNPNLCFTFDEAARRLLYDTLKDYRKDFHVVRLNSPSNPARIFDPDPLIWGQCLQNREKFVMEVERNKLDFAILREAKFLTTSMLFELHKENNSMKLYFCRGCQSIISKRWKCNICRDFYLCPDCHQAEEHPHFMLECQPISATPAYALPTFLDDLCHASQCQRSCCEYRNCGLTKMAYNHYIACPQRSTDFCSLCYQIIRCIAPHSAHCDRVNCPVPFCKDPNARITPAGSVHSSQSQNQFNLPSTSGTAPHSICDVWQQQQNTTTLNNPKQLSQNPGT